MYRQKNYRTGFGAHGREEKADFDRWKLTPKETHAAFMKHFRRGMRAYKAGNMGLAEGCFEECKRLEPDHKEGYARRKAAAFFVKAERASGDIKKECATRKVFLFQLPMKLEEIARASLVDLEKPSSMLGIGQLYLDMHKTMHGTGFDLEAVGWMNKALGSLKEDGTETGYIKARIRHLLAELEKQEMHLAEAARLDPEVFGKGKKKETT